DQYNTAMKWVTGYIYNKPEILGLGETNDIPEVLFPRFVQQELLKQAPGVSFDELGVRISNRKMALDTFDDFPRPTWVAATNKVAETLSDPFLTNSTFRAWNPAVFPPSVFNIFKIEISAGTNLISSGDLRCCDLHNRKFLVLFEHVSSSSTLVKLSLAAY